MVKFKHMKKHALAFKKAEVHGQWGQLPYRQYIEKTD